MWAMETTDPRMQDALVTYIDRPFGPWGKPCTAGYDAFETCDWDAGHCGPRPRYWRYFKHCACHWLVNDSLAIAKAALPVRRVQKAIEISRAE